jgi:hypothetical protein
LPSTRAIPDRDVFYVARPDRSVHSRAESFGRQTARDFGQLAGLLVGVVDAGG